MSLFSPALPGASRSEGCRARAAGGGGPRGRGARGAGSSCRSAPGRQRAAPGPPGCAAHPLLPQSPPPTLPPRALPEPRAPPDPAQPAPGSAAPAPAAPGACSPGVGPAEPPPGDRRGAPGLPTLGLGPLLHQLPRADFQLRPVPSAFAPQEREYQRAGAGQGVCGAGAPRLAGSRGRRGWGPIPVFSGGGGPGPDFWGTGGSRSVVTRSWRLPGMGAGSQTPSSLNKVGAGAWAPGSQRRRGRGPWIPGSQRGCPGSWPPGSSSEGPPRPKG